MAGKVIVVTRDERGNRDFSAKIEAKGGIALAVAAISVRPLDCGEQLKRVIERVDDYSWIVLTSINGVRTLFERLEELGLRDRFGGGAKTACIGTATSECLGQFGVSSDFVPGVFTSGELGRRLVAMEDLRGKRVLLLRSKPASAELAEILAAAGAQVDSISLYDIDRADSDVSELVDRIAGGQVDWLTFASGSSAKALLEMVDRDVVESSRVRVASIGPVTSKELGNMGISVDIEAREHTIDGLLAAVEGA